MSDRERIEEQPEVDGGPVALVVTFLLLIFVLGAVFGWVLRGPVLPL